MIKKEYILILVSLLALVSCSEPYDYRVTDLENSIVEYSELPLEVKDLLNHSDQYMCVAAKEYDGNYHCSLYCLNSDKEYEIEVIHPKFGPKAWVNYEILTDKNKQISYRLDKEMPSPYIIFQNILYVANEYNFIRKNQNLETINNLSFTCYSLK